MLMQRKGGNEPYSLTALTGHVGTKRTSNNLESTICFLGMIGNIVNVPPIVEPLPPGLKPPNKNDKDVDKMLFSKVLGNITID